jgi:gluconolactonase
MEVLTAGYGLIEGPVWDARRGLLFSDAQFGGVFALSRDDEVTTVFEHRRGIGGMALHEALGLVVSGRNIALKPFAGGDTITLLDNDPENDLIGFNDITTDASGRIYAGSLGSSPLVDDGREPRSGDLFLIDLDGSSRKVVKDVQLTNGLGFSPDGKTLYHSDSRRHAVFKYAVESNGDLGHKTPFAETSRGIPDGLVVSEDGAVWVALADGGKGVSVFGTDGKERDFIEIPNPMCTSVCFGGDDLTDLYIVSGSDGTGEGNAGGVYRVRTHVAGLPVATARTTIR